MNSIEGREFKTNLTLDKVGTCFPMALYTERPTTYGQNAIKLFLLACKNSLALCERPCTPAPSGHARPPMVGAQTHAARVHCGKLSAKLNSIRLQSRYSDKG